eukprot:2041917-Amphidinium_carterae.1
MTSFRLLSADDGETAAETAVHTAKQFWQANKCLTGGHCEARFTRVQSFAMESKSEEAEDGA